MMIPNSYICLRLARFITKNVLFIHYFSLEFSLKNDVFVIGGAFNALPEKWMKYYKLLKTLSISASSSSGIFVPKRMIVP